MKFTDARAEALAKGATDNMIDRHADALTSQVGTVPFNNMIRALQMHSWHNTAEDWARLAGALKCRSQSRKFLTRSPRRSSPRAGRR